MPTDHAQRARALVGCRFRPQGREPATGLDCIGLMLATFRIPADEVPRNYRLRGNDVGCVEHGVAEYFRRIPVGSAAPGDLLLCIVAPDQPHVAVKTEVGFVHAHAGLRRVVETPGDLPWPLVSVHRRRVRRKRGS